MKNDDVINLNVLCPWSCATSCRDADIIPLDIMFQKILPKIQIIFLQTKKTTVKFNTVGVNISVKIMIIQTFFLTTNGQ